MTENDRTIFYKAMIDCFDTFRETPQEKTSELYFRLLSEYDINTVLNALEFVLRSSKFFPKPAEIIEQIEGNENIIIDSAFEVAKKHWLEKGFYFNASFSDQLITETVKSIGGLQMFCEGLDKDRENGDSNMYFNFKRNYQKYYRLYKSGNYIPTVGILPGYAVQLPGYDKTFEDDVLPLLLSNKNEIRRLC